jgi:hypothetical protein
MGLTQMRVKNRSGRLAIALGLLFSRGAAAEVTSVEVTSTASLGEFGGKPYVEATGTMNGSVVRQDGTTGTYRVPITLEFPASHLDCNGVALGEPLHQGSGPASFNVIGRDTLFAGGYVHAAVGWDNSPGAGRSQGSTQRLSDAHLVLKDLSTLLRDPSAFLEGPCAASHVIGFGTSRTGFLWRDFLRLGHNSGLAFDGLLINAAGAGRLELAGTTRRSLSYPSPLPEDGLVIAINGEFDVERMEGWLARAETPSYRVYEVAGSPHLPTFILKVAGATRQNPAYHGPVGKAMFKHLHAWVLEGVPPPPSITLPGTVVPTPQGDLVPPVLECTAPCPIYQFERDAHGNATGGVRLPFVEVPIGTYTGVETLLDPATPAPVRSLISQGGTFTPFSEDLLRTLYPSRGAYVSEIADAAGAARDQGWILGEDVARYASEGAHLSIGTAASNH